MRDLSNRKLEWWYAAAGTFGFGTFLLAPASSMDSPAYEILISHFNEDVWGAVFCFTGALHIMALMLERYVSWAAPARILATFANTITHVAFGYGFALLDIWTTATYIYACAMGTAGAWCFITAVRDLAKASCDVIR